MVGDREIDYSSNTAHENFNVGQEMNISEETENAVGGENCAYSAATSCLVLFCKDQDN